MTAETRYPDIEIYLKRPDPDGILAWLGDRFSVVATTRDGGTTHCQLDHEGQVFDCIIVERAVAGGYTSIWFKSADTPWASDHDCAREAFARLGVETRCSRGPWNPDKGDDDTNGWLRITDAGESVVNWLA